MVSVVGIGAGGHAKVVMEILHAMNGFEVVGLLDANPELRGKRILNVEVLGDDSLLPGLYEQGHRHVFIGVGALGDAATRASLYAQVKGIGYEVVQAIHPTAIVSPSASIGDGVTVMAGVIINASARLSDNVIINTGAIVEHDCVIDAHAHIAPGARLAGSVHVGEGSHIGLGASVREGITIGPYAMVGAGAVVVKDVPEGATAVGVPARMLNRARK